MTEKPPIDMREMSKGMRYKRAIRKSKDLLFTLWNINKSGEKESRKMALIIGRLNEIIKELIEISEKEVSVPEVKNNDR